MAAWWRHIPWDDNLERKHANVLHDIGPKLHDVPPKYLFRHVIPRLPIHDYTAVIYHKLVEDGSLPEDKNWTQLPQEPTCDRDGCAEFLKGFRKVYHEILRAADTVIDSDMPAPTTRYASTRYGALPNSEAGWREGKSKPDMLFARCEKTTPTGSPWMDVALTGEYRRQDEKNYSRVFEDEWKKVLWGMHQTLLNDPRRRFTFGFTLDKFRMRIFYANRAEILTTLFDINDHPFYLIKFLLFATYATEAQLGWDPTMKYIGDKDGCALYDITVRSHTGQTKTYRATDMVYYGGATHIRGPGTRLWKVRRLNFLGKPVGKEMILKDCWADAATLREGDVTKTLQRLATTQEDKDILKRGFLTIVIHGDVYVDGWLDTTTAQEDHLRDLEMGKDLFEFPIHRSSVENYRMPIEIWAEKMPQYRQRTHYRIVFKEVCKSLYEEESLDKALGALSDVLRILKPIHAAGWVHRDLSMGNILIDESTGQTKLVDFEYAKKAGPVDPSDNKKDEEPVGTRAFVNIESQWQHYRFQPDDLDRTEWMKNRVPWFFNALHDVEAVFWLMAYLIVNHDLVLVPAPADPPSSTQPQDTLDTTQANAAEPKDTPDVQEQPAAPPALPTETEEKHDERINALDNLARSIFYGDGVKRQLVMTSWRYLQDELYYKQLLHPALQALPKLLLSVRRVLIDRYFDVEADLHRAAEDPGSVAGDIHDRFVKWIASARRYLGTVGAEVRLVPLDEAVDAAWHRKWRLSADGRTMTLRKKPKKSKKSKKAVEAADSGSPMDEDGEGSKSRSEAEPAAGPSCSEAVSQAGEPSSGSKRPLEEGEEAAESAEPDVEPPQKRARPSNDQSTIQKSESKTSPQRKSRTSRPPPAPSKRILRPRKAAGVPRQQK